MRSSVVRRCVAVAVVVCCSRGAVAQEANEEANPAAAARSAIRDVRLHDYQSSADLLKLIDEQIARLGAENKSERRAAIEKRLEKAREPFSETFVPKASNDLELHAVGIYEGSPFQPGKGLVKVRVTHRGAPIILCLSAYERVHWKISVDEGVQLKQVILNGYYPQSVDGIPESVSVADYSGSDQGGGGGIPYCYRRIGSPGEPSNYPAFCDELRNLTGLNVVTFLENYAPRNNEPLIVGPQNESWRDQRAFAGLEEVYDAAVEDAREQVWNAIKDLRFAALYRRPAGPNANPRRQRPDGEEVSAAEYTVLGPLALGLADLDEVTTTALDPRGVRRDRERFQLSELGTGVSTLLRQGADSGAPDFSHVMGTAYDSNRKRWNLVVQTNDGAWMYAYDVAEEAWQPLRQMNRTDVHVLAYDKQADAFLALVQEGHMGDGMTLYTFHPDGAVTARNAIEGLRGRFGPDHRPWVQLIPTEKYLVAIVTRHGDRNARDIDHGKVEMNVIDRATHRVVFSTEESEPDTLEGQFAQLQKRMALVEAPKFVPRLAPEPERSAVARVEISEDEAVAPLRNPKNGHFYELIRRDNTTWDVAKEIAEKRTYRGLSGYLVTITSPEENDFLMLNFEAGTIWLGASDGEEEGVWKWVVGPEAGQVFWRGDGAGKAEAYANWDRNEYFHEPNNMNEEDFLVWSSRSPFGQGRPDAPRGTWNDQGVERTADQVIVEFSLPEEAGGAAKEE